MADGAAAPEDVLFSEEMEESNEVSSPAPPGAGGEAPKVAPLPPPVQVAQEEGLAGKFALKMQICAC